MAGRALRFLGGVAGSYGSGCQVPCKTACLFVSPPASQFFTMMLANARDVLQLRKVGWDKEQLFDLQVDTCQCAGGKPSLKNAQPPPPVVESRAGRLPPAGEGRECKQSTARLLWSARMTSSLSPVGDGGSGSRSACKAATAVEDCRHIYLGQQVWPPL